MPEKNLLNIGADTNVLVSAGIFIRISMKTFRDFPEKVTLSLTRFLQNQRWDCF